MSRSALFRVALGVILTLALIGFLLALTAYQLTSETTGQRILRRAVATSTQLRLVLPNLETEVHRLAGEGVDPVTVPDFPITVELPAAEARVIAGDDLYRRILDESARRLYENGTSEWMAAEPGAQQDFGRISAPGLFDASLGLITDSNHRLFLFAAIALGVLSLLLAAAMLLGLPWDMRLLVLGLITLAAAVPSLAAAVGLRFALRTAEPAADPFVSALLELGVDATWVGIRNYLALSVLGLAITAVAGAVLWAESREVARQQPAAG